MHSSELTPNRSPTSEPFSYCDYARRRKLPDKADTVNCGESIGITSIPNFRLYTAIHRANFLPILILKRIYSLSGYTISSFRSSRLIPYATYMQDISYFHPYTGSQSLVPRADPICLIYMFYGREH